MVTPIILARPNLMEDQEEDVARYYFDFKTRRTECANRLVIPRYTALPFYEELVDDLAAIGSTVIESVDQFNWVKDMEWYNNLHEYTPQTWFDYTELLHHAPEGQFVVKGATNSKKWLWDSRMFAKSKDHARQIWLDLMLDTMLGEQGIVFRKYVPLKTFEVGINGLPFTNEWRCFCFRDRVLDVGYYWSVAEDETIAKARFEPAAQQLLDNLVKICAQHSNFYVLDLAETETGDWILVEVNSGMQSGMSLCNINTVYRRLKEGVISWQQQTITQN